MRERVIIHRVLCVKPLAVHDIPRAEHVIQSGAVDLRPLLEKMIVPFAGAALQKMPSVLQKQFSVGGKGDRGIRTVHLFLHNDMLSPYRSEGDLRQILISRLQP